MQGSDEGHDRNISRDTDMGLGRVFRSLLFLLFQCVILSDCLRLQTLTAETAAYLTTTHPDYSILAGRIVVSTLHDEVPHKCFSDVIQYLHCYGMSSLLPFRSSRSSYLPVLRL